MPPLPETITAGGKSRTVDPHLQQRANQRPDVTAANIQEVINNWLVRCISTDSDDNEGISYWGWISSESDSRVMHVVVSLDDERYVTAHRDRRALRALRKGTRGYFEKKCVGEIEVQDDN
ncbi:MAG: hypothetical protein OXD31_06725 [Chloroflexi bacterium]|nr:hypothetical protein [Chloroflexota bacterium]